MGCRATTTSISVYNAVALNLLQADVLGTLGADPADTQRKVRRPLHFSLALQASCYASLHWSATLLHCCTDTERC